MNTFLSRFTAKHAKLELNRTLVLTKEELSAEKQTIAAYYTLAASTVTKQGLPSNKSLPLSPLPVALLARLAVDKNFKENG